MTSNKSHNGLDLHSVYGSTSPVSKISKWYGNIAIEWSSTDKESSSPDFPYWGPGVLTRGVGDPWIASWANFDWKKNYISLSQTSG